MNIECNEEPVKTLPEGIDAYAYVDQLHIKRPKPDNTSNQSAQPEPVKTLPEGIDANAYVAQTIHHVE
jgi:hypothetical protein